MLTDIKEMITRHEKDEHFLYDDATGEKIISGYTVKGNPTIGRGHNLNIGISQAISDMLYAEDIAATKAFVIRNMSFFGRLSPNRQNALLDMAFTLRGKLLEFHVFLSCMGRGDWQGAHDAGLDSAWARTVGARAAEDMQLILEG